MSVFHSKTLSYRMHCAVIGVLILAGCSSPNFVSAPPATYAAPLPVAINGTWGNEVENGQRIRLSGQMDGTLELYFSQTEPSAEHLPAEPFLAKTLHFADADWLLLDWRKLALWLGEKPDAERPPYVLLKFALEKPDRLCSYEMNTDVFAEAIESGKLTGTVSPSGLINPYAKNIVVTTLGADWVKWWTALPEAKKTYGSTWCFVRVK